jgi:hypothetical protein
MAKKSAYFVGKSDLQRCAWRNRPMKGRAGIDEKP